MRWTPEQENAAMDAWGALKCVTKLARQRNFESQTKIEDFCGEELACLLHLIETRLALAMPSHGELEEEHRSERHGAASVNIPIRAA